MKAPRLEERRAQELSAELRERARAWIPSWALADGERDFGRALLEIAARFNSEVAERLDRAGEKMHRGFLDWLAVRGQAARPSRMPVVFKLADTAREAVLAEAPVRMQVDAAGASVIFETEKDVRLVPGSLATVIGVDADADAVYLPPPGLSDLEPLEPLPVQWQLKSFAATGATKLQVDPETGLVAGMILEADGRQYRIEKVDREIVTIDPPLTSALDALTILRKVTAFAPFDGRTRNRQEHALYLGHTELLDLESPATIAIHGAQVLRERVKWEYWGKVGDEEEAGWRELKLLAEEDQQPGAVVLKKEKGAIEPREIAGKSSRWIRGVTKNVPAGDAPFQADELAIGVNAANCSDPAFFPPGEEPPSVAAEGMANSTPLVLEDVFYPLGREPRQFDTFYLGSKEAFSKPGAQVQLHFDVADPSFESLAGLRGGLFANAIFAGVAGDGHLYLLYFDTNNGQLVRDNRGPLRPPSPKAGGTPEAGTPIPLDPRPAYRTPVWEGVFEFQIAVADANDTVWIWRQPIFAPQASGWENHGAPGPVDDSTQRITGLVHLADGASGQLFALRERKLFVRNLNDANPVWTLVETKDTNADPIELETIAPIAIENGSVGSGDVSEGLVGVDVNETLYAIVLAGGPLAGTCHELLTNVAREVVPAAVHRDSDDRVIAVAVGNDPQDRHFVAALTDPNDVTVVDDTADEPLPVLDLIGNSIDVNRNSGSLTFALSAQDAAQSTTLVVWTPFGSPLETPSLNTIPAAVGFAGGSPTLLPDHVFVPATSSQVLVAPFDVGDLKTFYIATLSAAVIASNAGEQLFLNDNVALPYDDNGTTKYERRIVTGPGVTRGAETLYGFDVNSIDAPWFVYPNATPVSAGAVDANDLTLLGLEAGDSVVMDEILLIATDQSTKLYTVVDPAVGPGIVQLDPALDVGNPNLAVAYKHPETSSARLRPLLELTAANNDWQASLLARTYLFFPGADPERQRGTAFKVDGNGKPELVALGEHWIVSPEDLGFGIEFTVDATIGDWTAQLGDTSSNPALSWEYGNGTSWWKLDPIHDETLNLKRSGNVRFTIPDDLRAMDWSGRTNFWIRARLAGGDYGREIVTVKTTPTGNPGETVQTIERSSSGIRAPSVVRLHIAYRLCNGVRPKFVYAQDSGSTRDQSDANTTRGAIVEAFVPLALTLGRLSNPAATAEEPAKGCAPPCHCPSETATARAVAPAEVAVPSPAAAARLATGRALFIGLNAAPSGAPVNVLLLVDKESPHEQFAPMKIEALAADRFVPIVAEDTTRALGESGVLSMAFAVEPAPRELFGKENLTWLRLTPGGNGPASEWTPALRGAYLNAVWASAAETLTRELLGSSEGAPDLTLRLARPPVLRDSLELRVNEPLGDEERRKLREGNENRVLSNVDASLPGDWVLWDRVIDPGDAEPGARVYALDESNGEIRFGDGQHGMIPPIGRDSIVAFTYRRTEIGGSNANDVPGNAVTARTALNLVSPVETVEAVFAADRAAGGAPTESPERVVRFGTARLRHRNRAVTARDFEDLALESSPDIVQARCLVRPNHVQLIVVMRGENPRPDAAEVRELRRVLLAAAPAALSAPQALRIEGPRIRRLRIVLELRVASLDDAGQVSNEVKKRVTALFDTATGGAGGDGWAAGAGPSEEDIALALLPTRRLEGLAKLELREVLADDVERPWSGAVKRDELVMLDKDPVRLEFKTVEVLA